MTGHLEVAKRYGLLGEAYELPKPVLPDDLIRVARDILAAAPARPLPTAQQVDRAAQEALLLENEDDELSDEISLVRKRLDDITRLKAGLTGYGGTARRRADRLQISEWFEDITREAQDCPLCGEAKHERSREEMHKIATAFRVVEGEANRTKEIPTSFAREEQSLRRQLETALERRKALSTRIDKTLAQNRAAKEQFDRRQSMFFFLGHLKASVDMFQNLVTGGDMAEAIATLESEEQALLKQVNPQDVKRRLEAALGLVAQKALVRLHTLDAEEKYKRMPPEFSVKDLSLKVQSNDGHWHFLAEVGSASNWLSFHIAFICALHEYFNEMQESSVPSFAVFDQPSQVYFPKTARGEQRDDQSQYDDEDVKAVIGIFKTLADSVRAQRGKWQCIVLDHARDEIYGEIDEVHEVDVWRDGKKLIPPHWYQ
jgi:GH24 family phage-related lysozyme (muramidase)